MNEHIICGIINIGEESPIYCNPTTGDCYFYDEVGAARLIWGINITDPVEPTDEDYNGIGFIQCARGEYCILDEESAEFRNEDGDVEAMSIDIYADYEDEDDL